MNRWGRMTNGAEDDTNGLIDRWKNQSSRCDHEALAA